jgi:alpha-glucosidase
MNGPTARTVSIPLSVLGGGNYQAMVVRDQKEDAAAVRIENISVSRKDRMAIELRDGGGFIARFSKQPSSRP